ncbi:hypothetical protein [Clostridium sp.]|uniref:hypothetical protein n=1 Tax=Clostridium sp. TaxID=1506 RepID=UPI002603C208|nr:hypothetical protein [Clostridium sp.]
MGKSLGFHVYTTKYIGGKEDIKYILKNLDVLPKKYMPTKYEINNYRNLFSIDNLDDILEKSSNRNFYSVNLSVYKIKRIFEMAVSFKRKPLPNYDVGPNRIFHRISFYIDDGIGCINRDKEFNILRSLWINYCEVFEAIYGQCILYAPYQNSNNYLGWGHGICISRLHWQNYFGKPFAKVFDYDKDVIRNNCVIEKCQSGATILTLKANPTDITLRTDIERQVINSLGNEYFWNENDNRLNPKIEYKLIELIHEVMYDPIEIQI